MAIWSGLLGGRQYQSLASDREIVQLEAKDYDYSRFTPEVTLTPFTGLTMGAMGGGFGDYGDFAKRAKLLLQDCPVSKACIEKRAQGVADIVLSVKGNELTRLLTTSPNTRDKTMAAALKSWEIQLSVGGDLYLFFDKRVPGRPQVSSLRQDAMVNNIKASQYEYRPGGDSLPAELIFGYDATGSTVRASQHRGGGSYQVIDAGLQRISYYNPLSPNSGIGAGDSAIRSIQVWLLIDDLVERKFRSGGTQNGYFSVQGLQHTDAQLSQIQRQMDLLNHQSGANVLMGVDFLAAQMNFTELDVRELRDKYAETICTAFNVKAHMIGIGVSTHANSRSDDKIFYRNFIGPEASWLIGQLEWGVKRYIDPRAQITVDETQIQHIQDDIRDNVVALAGTGIMTVNELRAKVGEPALPGPEGEQLTGNKAVSANGTGLGQPETKPGGDTAFNANAGDRGDKNGQ